MKNDRSFAEEFRLQERLIREDTSYGNIDYRQAYYGGRVETFKLLHEVDADEELLYLDVRGLFPTVMFDKKNLYAVDHSLNFTHNSGDLMYHGVLISKPI